MLYLNLLLKLGLIALWFNKFFLRLNSPWIHHLFICLY